MRACKPRVAGVHHERHRVRQSPVGPNERRPRARRDAAPGRRRPDVRHGRLSAAAVLRCDPSARAAPSSDQRRAHRRLRGGRLCAGHGPPRRVRRHARAGRHQSRHRTRRGAQRRHAVDRDHRRHPSRPCLEEHDPGVPPDRRPAPCGQGADPRRRGCSHSRAGAPRVRAGELGSSRPGAARRSRGRLPRRARVRGRGFLYRRRHGRGAGKARAAGAGGGRGCGGAAREGPAAAGAGRWRGASLRRASGAAGARRAHRHAGCPHHERQGRDRLHAPAVGGSVRTLLPHRQRSHRRVGLSARGRLQARRDRDQALHAAAAERSDHPSRHFGRGDRAVRAGRGHAVGRRPRGTVRFDRGPASRCGAAARDAGRLFGRAAAADGEMA